METAKNSQWFSMKGVVLVFVVALVTYLIVNAQVGNRLREVETSVNAQIAEQQVTLAAIAETMARNGADAVTESIIIDCRERSQFEELLGRLNTGLSRSELTELERLFGRCGGFFAERKSVMTARLSREIEVYENYVDQLSIITGSDERDTHKVQAWQDLSQEENTQSELYTELVNLQDSIIKELLSGKTANSDEIKEILNKVRETKENLILANKQAGTIRSELVTL